MYRFWQGSVWKCSHVIGVTFGVSFFIFRFYHNRIDCLSNFLFWQWCIWTIIMLNHSFQQIRIIFFFLGGHAHLFICQVNSVQNIPTTFEYIKIDRHFICNWRLLILCLNICVFFLFIFLWTNSNSSSSVEHLSTMMPFDSSLSVEQICDKVSSNRNSFNSLSSVKKHTRPESVLY